jgi:hypothetical protein
MKNVGEKSSENPKALFCATCGRDRLSRILAECPQNNRFHFAGL